MLVWLLVAVVAASVSARQRLHAPAWLPQLLQRQIGAPYNAMSQEVSLVPRSML